MTGSAYLVDIYDEIMACSLTYITDGLANHGRPISSPQKEDNDSEFVTSLDRKNFFTVVYNWDDHKKDLSPLETSDGTPDKVWFLEFEKYSKHVTDDNHGQCKSIGEDRKQIGFVWNDDRNSRLREVLQKLKAKRKATITRITTVAEYEALTRDKFFHRGSITFIKAARTRVRTEGVGFYCIPAGEYQSSQKQMSIDTTLQVYNRYVA
ncbi:hypothetical protein DPSP01_011904 [Paraphaeosphaeria sporulosa]